MANGAVPDAVEEAFGFFCGGGGFFDEGAVEADGSAVWVFAFGFGYSAFVVRGGRASRILCFLTSRCRRAVISPCQAMVSGECSQRRRMSFHSPSENEISILYVPILQPFILLVNVCCL